MVAVAVTAVVVANITITVDGRKNHSVQNETDEFKIMPMMPCEQFVDRSTIIIVVVVIAECGFCV